MDILHEVFKAVEEASSSEKYQVPNALKQFISKGFDSLTWQRVTPSFEISVLLKDADDSQIALSRVKPGGKMAPIKYPHINSKL